MPILNIIDENNVAVTAVIMGIGDIGYGASVDPKTLLPDNQLVFWQDSPKPESEWNTEGKTVYGSEVLDSKKRYIKEARVVIQFSDKAVIKSLIGVLNDILEKGV